MTTQPNLADRIAHMEADLDFLREKSDQDDKMISLLKRQNETQAMEISKMISLLKRQNETQAMEISKMSADYAEEVRALRQRCDLAVRNEREITGILETAVSGILQDLRKMKGDQTPAPRRAPTGQSTEALPQNELPAGPIRHPRLPAPPEVAKFARGGQLEATEPVDIIDDGLAEMVRRFPAPQQATRR